MQGTEGTDTGSAPKIEKSPKILFVAGGNVFMLCRHKLIMNRVIPPSGELTDQSASKSRLTLIFEATL